MKRPATAIAAIALAFSAPAALAASGDAWYDTNRDLESVRISPVEVTRAEPDRVVVYEERTVRPAPMIVERDSLYAPREIVVYREERDLVDMLNPHTDHRVGRGLFPRRGPNDFGQ